MKFGLKFFYPNKKALSQFRRVIESQYVLQRHDITRRIALLHDIPNQVDVTPHTYGKKRNSE